MALYELVLLRQERIDFGSQVVGGSVARARNPPVLLDEVRHQGFDPLHVQRDTGFVVAQHKVLDPIDALVRQITSSVLVSTRADEVIELLTTATGAAREHKTLAAFAAIDAAREVVTMLLPGPITACLLRGEDFLNLVEQRL